MEKAQRSIQTQVYISPFASRFISLFLSSKEFFCLFLENFHLLQFIQYAIYNRLDHGHSRLSTSWTIFDHEHAIDVGRWGMLQAITIMGLQGKALICWLHWASPHWQWPNLLGQRAAGVWAVGQPCKSQLFLLPVPCLLIYNKDILLTSR